MQAAATSPRMHCRKQRGPSRRGRALRPSANLHAFFRTSLIREIDASWATRGRFRSMTSRSLRPSPGPGTAPPTGSLPAAVEEDVQTRVLAEKILARFERDRDELMAMVPARSNEPSRYQYAIVRAARAIFCLLVQGTVVSADWNDLIRAEYPEFYAPPDGRGWTATVGEPALAGSRRAYSATTKKDQNSIDQRLRRARQDVRSLLRCFSCGASSRSSVPFKSCVPACPRFAKSRKFSPNAVRFTGGRTLLREIFPRRNR